ncbi:MAG: PIN domain-containing protein [Armatimonadetes bacterium]|nr:PIN domain-containing protein [Armatimonadota bacterium]
MTIFVDTSALLAVMSNDDANHPRIKPLWDRCMDSGGTLVTTNYVVLELHALVQRRFGMAGIALLDGVFLPALSVHWVTREEHELAGAAVTISNRRDLSLVDCVSFVVMREMGIGTAFTLDAHFEEQGFEVMR